MAEAQEIVNIRPFIIQIRSLKQRVNGLTVTFHVLQAGSHVGVDIWNPGVAF